MNLTDKIANVLDDPENILSTREVEFLKSIKSQSRIRGLSEGQQRWFDQIASKYSEESILKRQMWMLNWTDEHRDIAKKVAIYYKNNPPYFSSYVAQIEADPEGFCLTETQWTKFCENKYALKIRNIYEEDLKYQQGDCIQVRKTNKVSYLNSNYSGRTLADKVGFVVGRDVKPVTRAAKGSRIYRILVTGLESTILVHESDIKKHRRPKK